MKTTINKFEIWDGSALVFYAVLSTLLGIFLRSVLPRTVLRRTVLCQTGGEKSGHAIHSCYALSNQLNPF